MHVYVHTCFCHGVCVYMHTHTCMHMHQNMHGKSGNILPVPQSQLVRGRGRTWTQSCGPARPSPFLLSTPGLGTVRISTPVKWKMILENTEAGVCNQSSSCVARWTDMGDCWIYRKRVWIGTVAEFYTDPELLNSYWGSVPAQTQSKRLALGQHVPAQTPHSSLRALPLPLAMDYNNLC